MHSSLKILELVKNISYEGIVLCDATSAGKFWRMLLSCLSIAVVKAADGALGLSIPIASSGEAQDRWFVII